MPDSSKTSWLARHLHSLSLHKIETSYYVFISGTVLTFVLIVSCIISLITLHKAELQVTQTNLNRLALILSEQTSLAFHEIDLVTQEARTFFLANPTTSPQVLHDKFHSLFQHFLQGQALLLFDATGKMIIHSRVYPTPDVRVADRDYFQAQARVDDDTLFISAPLRNRVNGNWMISLSRRITRGDGTFAGVLMAAIEMRYFTRLYHALDLPPGTRIYLERMDGTILTSYPFDPEVLGRVRPLEATVVHTLVANHGVGDLPVVISLTIAKTTALRRWQALAWMLIPSALVGVLGIGILTASLMARVKKDQERAIAQRHSLEEQVRKRTVDLQDLLEFNEKIIESSPIGIAVYAQDGQCLSVNNVFCHIVRLDKTTLLTHNFNSFRLLEPTGLTDFAGQALNTGVTTRREGSFRTADGQQIWLDFQIVRFFRNNNKHLLLLCTDITERKALEEELRSLAYTDSLTGVQNRRRFLELAQAEIVRAKRNQRPFAFLILDVDHFKDINDSFGHVQGDKVLVSLAATSRESLRESDIFGRLGGEEFGALLLETEREPAIAAAERLRTAVEQRVIALDGNRISITVSVGLGFWRETDTSVGDLMRRADKALYAAKHSGRNRVMVDGDAAPNS